MESLIAVCVILIVPVVRTGFVLLFRTEIVAGIRSIQNIFSKGQDLGLNVQIYMYKTMDYVKCGNNSTCSLAMPN